MGVGVYRRPWRYSAPNRRIAVGGQLVGAAVATFPWQSYRFFLHHLNREPGVFRERWKYEQYTRYRMVMPITITAPDVEEAISEERYFAGHVGSTRISSFDPELGGI